MNKKLVLGMVAVTLTMSFSAAFAGGARAVDRMPEYSKDIKEKAFSGKQTAVGLDAAKMTLAQSKLLAVDGLKGSKESLEAALRDPAKKAERLNNLAVIVAGLKMSEDIKKTDVAEGESLEKAAQASAKLLANSTKLSKGLTGSKETQEITESLVKLESLPEAILTRFSKAERDSYTQIMDKTDELLNGKIDMSNAQSVGSVKTAEEAFIQAIMQVKNVDRTKALEVARKLRECV